MKPMSSVSQQNPEPVLKKRKTIPMSPVKFPSWKAYKFAVLDIEGTGAQDKEREEILEVAVLLIDGQQITERVFHSLVNPQRKFKEHPWVYLKNSDVAQAPSFDLVRPQLEDFLKGTVMVAHNTRVDWNILKLKKVAVDIVGVIDTLKIAKKLYPKPHNLEALAKNHMINAIIEQAGQPIQPHRAVYDARVTAHLFLKMMEKFPEVSLDQLIKDYGIETNSTNK